MKGGFGLEPNYIDLKVMIPNPTIMESKTLDILFSNSVGS